MKQTKQENFLGTVEEDMRKIGAHLALDMPDLKINFDRSDEGGKTGSSISVDSKGCDLKLAATFDGSHESHYWA